MKRKLLLLTLLLSGAALVQAARVTGIATGEDGLPAPGVNVVVKGTSVGAVTGADGRYSINAPDGATTLVFSSLEHATQEVAISGSEVNASMTASAKSLDEVVVTAMGMKRDRKALGYAVQDIKSEDLTRGGNSNVIGALQGKVAGVEINPSSGSPGASAQLVIRGARSFTGNNTPLYVIDGMPIASTFDYNTDVTNNGSVGGADLSNRAIDLDPNDIESINILKGQAAAALYGIRASNGVVVITTKSGRNTGGKVTVSFSNSSSLEQISRKPDIQQTYAQGVYGSYVPNTSMSWGPKISDLPNDPTYGGNNNGHPDMYKVTQLEQAGLDPWVTPKAYDNVSDFYQTGYTVSNSVNVGYGDGKSSIALGLGSNNQQGIISSTDMSRYNGKLAGERILNDMWKVGFSGNYSQTAINKASGANDGLVATVMAAPPSYNMKGIPSHYPGDPYAQINYRNLTFNNPYWAMDNNKFYEETNRFFGNGYIEFAPKISWSEDKYLNFRYQLGVDSYSSNYEDCFGYGSKGGSGNTHLYGLTSTTYNSLLTANYSMDIIEDLHLAVLAGNEINYEKVVGYDETGTNFNFGGWNHISNTEIQTTDATHGKALSVGTFANVELSYNEMLFLNATGRYDKVSSMPRDNRGFFYPSVSLGFVFTALEAIQDKTPISFGKLRVSYAEVGQAGTYLNNFYYKPSYGGGWWDADPIIYPVSGVSAYIPYFRVYDTNLKPQNTISYEVGADLRFFNNLIGIDYTFSRQNVKDQIFPIPLAGSSGAQELYTNGGKMHTNAHEVILTINALRKKDWDWTILANFSKIDNYVDELAQGVESITLGGFVTPQVRANIGDKFPVIYGGQYAKDDQGRVLVDEDPNSYYYGMPIWGEDGVIGSVSPDFIVGLSSTLRWKSLTLAATFDWKQGGYMYSGTNGLYYTYGLAKETQDRETPFVYPGYKSDGTPNNIVRGGLSDPDAYQDLYSDVLGNIDEAYVFESSYIKLREVSLTYKFPRYRTLDVSLTAFARNILLWTTLPNLDPESSQGNNNMTGAFERFSVPQTTSIGLGLNLTF